MITKTFPAKKSPQPKSISFYRRKLHLFFSLTLTYNRYQYKKTEENGYDGHQNKFNRVPLVIFDIESASSGIRDIVNESIVKKA